MNETGVYEPIMLRCGHKKTIYRVLKCMYLGKKILPGSLKTAR
jgi:hypothetical protein